jgi:ubiquinone/menaquinone biosynthesis C-methylase UbiE
MLIPLRSNFIRQLPKRALNYTTSPLSQSNHRQISKMAFPGMTSVEWDVHSKEYASMNLEHFMPAPCKRLLSAMDAVNPLSSATAILDVGCGPGTMIAHLATDYGTVIPSSARIVASDFSSGMVDCVRERKIEKAGKESDVGGVWSRLETQVYDAQDLSEIKDGEMSHLMSNMVYFMLPDPRKGLREAHRVLKDNGTLTLTSWSKVEWMDMLNQAARIVRSDAPAGFDVERLGAWANREGLKEEFEACGFKEVTTDYMPANMPMQDPVMFANKFIKSNNPGALMVVGEFSEEELDRVCEEWVKLVGTKETLEGVLIVASGKK